MRARKVDTTQREIVQGLRGLGWLVEVVNGKFDLLICVGGQVFVADCKTPKSGAGRVELTDGQRAMIADGWPLLIIVSAQDAADQIAARRRAPVGVGLQ